MGREGFTEEVGLKDGERGEAFTMGQRLTLKFQGQGSICLPGGTAGAVSQSVKSRGSGMRRER